MKVMIDTNVVLDVLLRREPHFENSYAVMRKSALEEIEGFISASAATDIYYLLRRSLRDDARARDCMERLTQLVGIADALGEDVYAALASGMSDFEDALVAAIAQRCQMTCVVTRNAKDYAGAPVQALSPEEFLRRYGG